VGPGTYARCAHRSRAAVAAGRAFVSGVAKAIEWARTQPRETVIAEFRKIVKSRGRNEDDSQPQFWKSTGVAGAGGLIADTEFQTWIDWLTKDGELTWELPALPSPGLGTPVKPSGLAAGPPVLSRSPRGRPPRRKSPRTRWASGPALTCLKVTLCPLCTPGRMEHSRS
jgi:hypothetical protein